MLLCGSFRAVGSFRTGKGSESTHSRIPHPKPQLELPSNGGKPFRQTGILTLNPPLAGQALNFSEPQFTPGLHRDTHACPQILFSSEEVLEKFLVGGGHVQYMLVFPSGCPQLSSPSSASLHPPGGLMLPHLMLQPRACFAFTEHRRFVEFHGENSSMKGHKSSVPALTIFPGLEKK